MRNNDVKSYYPDELKAIFSRKNEEDIEFLKSEINHLKNVGTINKRYGPKSILHYAACLGDTTMVSLLLAEPEIQNNLFEDVRLLEEIVDNDQLQTAQQLVQHYRNQFVNESQEINKLLDIAWNWHKKSSTLCKLFVFLLSQGANGDSILDSEGNTPLFQSLTCRLPRDEECIKYLLEHSSNVQRKNYKGQGVFHLTNITRNNKKIIQSLLNRGANINFADAKGCTPLHLIARSNNNEWALKFLVSNGAHLNQKNIYGLTPLHLAVEMASKDYRSVLLLLDNGAEINSLSFENGTPLDIAEKKGDANLVKLLLDKGAKPSIRKVADESPVDVAPIKSLTPQKLNNAMDLMFFSSRNTIETVVPVREKAVGSATKTLAKSL